LSYYSPSPWAAVPAEGGPHLVGCPLGGFGSPPTSCKPNEQGHPKAQGTWAWLGIVGSGPARPAMWVYAEGDERDQRRLLLLWAKIVIWLERHSHR